MMIIKERKELGVLKGIVLPSLSILCCLFMIVAAIYAHGVTPLINALENGKFSCPIIAYLIVFTIIMIIGTIFYLRDKKETVN